MKCLYKLPRCLSARVGDSRDAPSAAPYLTIRRLGVWLAEPIRRMRLLAAMADATAGLTGGALAGAVYSHVHAHGDPFVRSYASKVPCCFPSSEWFMTSLKHLDCQTFP